MINPPLASSIHVIDGVKKAVDTYGLDATSLLQGCYAFRFPALHFISIFHSDDKYPQKKRFGDLTYFASDLIGGLLWFHKINVIKVFKVVMLSPLNRLSVCLRGVSYLFYGAHALKGLKGSRKVQSLLDLSAAVAQVALAIIMVIGVTSGLFLTAATFFAYGLTAVSVLYSAAMMVKSVYAKFHAKQTFVKASS